MLEKIRELLEQGKTREQIQELIGVGKKWLDAVLDCDGFQALRRKDDPPSKE